MKCFCDDKLRETMDFMRINLRGMEDFFIKNLRETKDFLV